MIYDRIDGLSHIMYLAISQNQEYVIYLFVLLLSDDFDHFFDDLREVRGPTQLYALQVFPIHI